MSWLDQEQELVARLVHLRHRIRTRTYLMYGIPIAGGAIILLVTYFACR